MLRSEANSRSAVMERGRIDKRFQTKIAKRTDLVSFTQLLNNAGLKFE